MIEHSRDFRRIKKLCADDWKIDISQDIYYLIEVKDGEDLGVWMFHPFEDGLMIHANFSEKCRGKAAADSARNAFNWIFEHTGVNIIYAGIHNDKRHVQMLACAVGFAIFQRTDSYRLYTLKAG